MRGDGVGVGDVDEVSSRSRVAEHSQDCDDHLGACWQHFTGLVSGRDGAEPVPSDQSTRDRIGIGDSTRSQHGTCDIHRLGMAGADGMRGNRVGVGDIGEMSSRACRSRHPSSGGDGRGADWERNAKLLYGYGRTEHD